MLSGLIPILVTAGAGLLALLGIVVKSRSDGAKLERAKQAAEDARARDIADQVDNDVGALPPDAAREELRKWSR